MYSGATIQNFCSFAYFSHTWHKDMKIKEYQMILKPSVTFLVELELDMRELNFSWRRNNNGYIFKFHWAPKDNTIDTVSVNSQPSLCYITTTTTLLVWSHPEIFHRSTPLFLHTTMNSLTRMRWRRENDGCSTILHELNRLSYLTAFCWFVPPTNLKFWLVFPGWFLLYCITVSSWVKGFLLITGTH